MSVPDYRPGIDEQTDPARGSLFNWLGWAIYLGISWTWCIGMFLPVLLVRDYGVWGWIVFAVPNVIGAAAMGWVLRSAEQSRQMVRAHRAAMIGFSFITAAFQIFFTLWIFSRFGLDGNDFGKTTLALALIIAFLCATGRAAVGPVIAAGVLVVACLCIVRTGRTGELMPIHALMRNPGSPPLGALFLIPAMLVGFALCPYLDLTFHDARQRLSRSAARVAFSLGFGVFFFAMIIFTLFYAPAVWMRLVDSDLMDNNVFLWWLQVYLLVQLGFTIGVHWHSGGHATEKPSMGQSFYFMLGSAAVGFAAFFVSRRLHFAAYEGGEFVYRCFMSFYGLVFPAYAWICMAPTWRQPERPTRHMIVVLAATVLLASPLFAMAFLGGRMFWLLPGVAIILLAKLLNKCRRPVVDTA